jgi:signal peptidase I
MSNLPAGPNQVPSSETENLDPNPRSTWKKATLASLLSLVFPGTGQLLNRHPRKGFVLASITYVFTLLTVKTRLLFIFPTMVATILAGIIWKLFVAAEAGYAAAAARKPESAVPMPRFTYPFLVVMFVAAAVFTPSAGQIKSETGFAAFKIPSASMCPTICLGERIVADMHAYKLSPLQRGDLILMRHQSSGALFVKRVIGVAGDTVAPGPTGSILVNGQPFSPPGPCGGTPILKTKDSADYSMFHSTTVPEGSLFVVGDNIGNSFDSRIPEFGPVTPDMVRGKPLFLYWSPSISRTGCSLR